MFTVNSIDIVHNGMKCRFIQNGSKYPIDPVFDILIPTSFTTNVESSEGNNI